MAVGCPAASCCGRRWRRPSGSWPRRDDRRNDRLPVAVGDAGPGEGPGRDTQAADRGEPVAADRRSGSRRTSRQARSFVVLVDPGRVRVPARRGRDRRRHRAQTSGRCYQRCPAPRLPTEPMRRGLLVPLSVPPVALRPTGRPRLPGSPSDRRPMGWIGSRSRSTSGGVADRRPDAADPRSTAGRPRSAGAHPAEGRERLHVSEGPDRSGGPARPPGGGLLRLYPRAWRNRYEEEFVVVLDPARPVRATGSTSPGAPSTRSCTRHAVDDPGCRGAPRGWPVDPGRRSDPRPADRARLARLPPGNLADGMAWRSSL